MDNMDCKLLFGHCAVFILCICVQPNTSIEHYLEAFGSATTHNCFRGL